jgi:nucleotide sugar dehydrogenase
MVDVAVIGAGGIVGGALAAYFETCGVAVKKNDIKGGADMVGLDDAISENTICFVCVPTPSKSNGSINLEHVIKATHDIGAVCKRKGFIPKIVYKSTMVPGSTKRMERLLHLDFDIVKLAYNPEFLRQNFAIQDMLAPSRIVVGSNDHDFAAIVMELYSKSNSPKFTFDSWEGAELVKYYANAYYASRISFFNQMSLFAKEFKCSHGEIVDAIVADKSVGVHGSNPTGQSYAGACLIKDVDAIIYHGKKNGIDTGLLDSVKRVNESFKNKR